jgi:hypothetical protein
LTNDLSINLNSNTTVKVESMSNKYVPRFMAKVAPADQTPSVTPSTTPSTAPAAAPAAAPSRWARDEDIYRISPKKQNLVNTSLPAKMAPVLAPATLSALTAQEKRTPKKAKEIALPSEDDFPTLGKKASQVSQVTQVTATKSFSELSKAWATTQKEDEAKAKEEAAAEALRLQQQQKKEAEEFIHHGVQHLSIRTKHLRYVNQRADDEDDTENMTPPEDDEYDNDDDEEEEDDEEECDGNWNARKHRDELY